MEIKAIDAGHRGDVNSIVAQEWAGPMLVTRGKVLDASVLPGFVCTEGGEILGAALYDIRCGECELAALISLKENTGVGERLIRAVEDAAHAQHCTRLWLVTTNDNTRAIRYYQKRGFALKAVHIGAVADARKIKPGIPLLGLDGIPILHELEFERTL